MFDIQNSVTVVRSREGKRYKRIFEQLEEGKKNIVWQYIDDNNNVIDSWDASEGAYSLPQSTGKRLEQTYNIVIKGGKTR